MTELRLIGLDGPNFDAIMRSHADVEDLNVYLEDGVYVTAGTKQWEDTEQGFRMGRHWTFDLAPNARVVWDFEAAEITEVPIHLFLSTEARFHPDFSSMSPEDIWNRLPRGQAVRGGTLDLQFSQAVKRWRSAGKKLNIGGVLLSGHQATIETHVTNYGAWGGENFPLVITGGIGQPDRDAIAKLDSTHILDDGLSNADCSHITNSLADGYDESSNDQVTVRMIVGNMGERSPGEWVQHFRRFAYQSGNRTIATGKNLVQAHTIYQSLAGSIDHNYSNGARVGVYGDFYSTKRLDIELNEFLACDHGVALYLSPTGPGNEQYSHESYTIGPNKIVSKGANVSLKTLGPPTGKRFIRDIGVDASLTVESEGAEFTRIGVERAQAKGCNPFRRS